VLPRLFALEPGHGFADRVAAALGVDRDPVEERVFEDGEVKVRALAGVRAADCVVVQSLDGGAEGRVHDRLMRVLMLVGALKDAGARRVIGAFPYLAYARKDRRTKPQDPLSLRYVAQMFEAVGLDAVMALEVHDLPAFENAFRIPAIPLDTRRLFVARARELVDDRPLVVVSPDPGGIKRAQLFAEMLETEGLASRGLAVVEKRRTGGVVSGDMVAGDVAGATPLVVDDLTSSGGTLARAAEALVRAGAAPPLVAVAHGVFDAAAAGKLAEAPIERLLVTDSIDPPRLTADDLTVLERVGCAELVAEAIRRVLAGGSIAALLGD
jgi:ribose-phosphate pyrophosphokinase